MVTPEAEWTWREAVREATARLDSKGLTIPKKPVSDYESLSDIVNLEGLSDQKLANLMGRCYAWYSYATVEMAYSKAKLISFDEIYEVMLGKEMHRLGRTQEGRVVKDVLRSMAIMQSDNLRACHRLRIELQLNCQMLEGLVRGLEIQSKALESESIRRASERRLEGSR